MKQPCGVEGRNDASRGFSGAGMRRRGAPSSLFSGRRRVSHQIHVKRSAVMAYLCLNLTKIWFK